MHWSTLNAKYLSRRLAGVGGRDTARGWCWVADVSDIANLLNSWEPVMALIKSHLREMSFRIPRHGGYRNKAQPIYILGDESCKFIPDASVRSSYLPMKVAI